jgi:hypothetical protein
VVLVLRHAHFKRRKKKATLVYRSFPHPTAYLEAVVVLQVMLRCMRFGRRKKKVMSVLRRQSQWTNQKNSPQSMNMITKVMMKATTKVMAKMTVIKSGGIYRHKGHRHTSMRIPR